MSLELERSSPSVPAQNSKVGLIPNWVVFVLRAQAYGFTHAPIQHHFEQNPKTPVSKYQSSALWCWTEQQQEEKNQISAAKG